MELLKSANDIPVKRGRPFNPLYEKIAGLKKGTVARCDQGVDFEEKPEQFRQAILYAMKRKNVHVTDRKSVV